MIKSIFKAFYVEKNKKKSLFFANFAIFLLYFAPVFEKILIDKVAISLAKFDVPAIPAIFLGYSAGVE